MWICRKQQHTLTAMASEAKLTFCYCYKLWTQVLLLVKQRGDAAVGSSVLGNSETPRHKQINSNQINVTPVAMKLKKLMPAIH
jgi:hypothetical protein